MALTVWSIRSFPITMMAKARRLSRATFTMATPIPEFLNGALFYGDFVRGIVRYLTFDQNMDLAGDFPFADSVGAVVDIRLGPDQMLYFVDLFGSIRRFVFDPEGAVPTITEASASVSTGAAPLSIQFVWKRDVLG